MPLRLFVSSCFVFALAQHAFAQDMDDLLKNAKPATAPAPVTSPTDPNFLPTTDALGTRKPKPPENSRTGTLILNSGPNLTGHLWTTTATPLRLWIEETKTYLDIDLSLIKRIDVHVLSQTMEDEWRWLKEGSDQKVYSGKKYPNLDLAYIFTLLNDQQIEGTIVAPIYFVDDAKAGGDAKPRTFALYKKFKGTTDQTLEDVIYITHITLDPPSPAAATLNDKKTTKLPLLDD